MNTVKVFIGYDSRQPIAPQVLAHSIWTRSTRPVEITRLQLGQLPIKRVGLTEFTYSRFLVPWLCGFSGYAIFIDSDFLCRADISDLLGIVMANDLTSSDKSALWVSKNKLRFEWPSLMVFNNERCKVLAPEFVDDSANSLFDLAWAETVGELPREWNHLVGYDEPNPDAKMVHFTQGIPCWPETRDSEFAEEWRAAGKHGMSTVEWESLMGQSVHAAPVKARLAAKSRGADMTVGG